MKQLFIYTIILSAGFYLSACDETTPPGNVFEDAPSITQLNVNPKVTEFTLEGDGFKDTTLTIQVSIGTENTSEETIPRYTISNKNSGEVIGENEFEITDSRAGNFGSMFDLETTTTTFEDYIVNAVITDESGNGNYAQTTFSIMGFSNNPPEIIETDSPGEIQRPESGEVPATFTAKVTDKDGQNTIAEVNIRVINQVTGEVQGSPFEMFDNGSTYGDEMANDSTYTWSLPVTPTENNPNRDFDIEFFAIDKGGLASDTVKTTFSIVE